VDAKIGENVGWEASQLFCTVRVGETPTREKGTATPNFSLVGVLANHHQFGLKIAHRI